MIIHLRLLILAIFSQLSSSKPLYQGHHLGTRFYSRGAPYKLNQQPCDAAKGIECIKFQNKAIHNLVILGHKFFFKQTRSQQKIADNCVIILVFSFD